MRTVTLKLPKHLDEALDRLARQRGTTRSAILRDALASYAARPKVTLLDLAGDLIGAFKGGPRDLATNPKHLEGFGESRPPRRRSGRRAV